MATFALATYWPIVAAVFVVAATTAFRSRAIRIYRYAVIGIALALSCIGTAVILRAAPDSVLTRDAVATIAVALFAPTASAAVGRLLGTWSAWGRCLASLLAGLLLVCASPLFILIVHCTSGDCL